MSRSGDLNPGLLRDSPKLYHWATEELILNRLKKVVNKLSAAFHTNRKIKMRISPKGPDNFFCTLPIWNRYYPSFNLAYNSNESSKVFCPYNSHSLWRLISQVFMKGFSFFQRRWAAVDKENWLERFPRLAPLALYSSLRSLRFIQWTLDRHGSSSSSVFSSMDLKIKILFF